MKKVYTRMGILLGFGLLILVLFVLGYKTNKNDSKNIKQVTTSSLVSTSSSSTPFSYDELNAAISNPFLGVLTDTDFGNKILIADFDRNGTTDAVTMFREFYSHGAGDRYLAFFENQNGKATLIDHILISEGSERGLDWDIELHNGVIEASVTTSLSGIVTAGEQPNNVTFHKKFKVKDGKIIRVQ